MKHEILKEVYRIDVDGFTCRSAQALVTMNALEIDDVEAVTLGRDDTLLVVSASDRDIYDELILAAVDSGLEPGAVRMVSLEPLYDMRPLSLDEAQCLGLIETPREPVRATIETVQRIYVEVTDGYDPDTIIVEAGLPSEIEFSEGHGCLGRVVFEQLGIDVDLENGGTVVRLPGLEPGTYGFRCGMDMVHGTLIAE